MENYNIYFNKEKEAFAFEIENPLCTIDSATWEKYAGTDKWDIINGTFVDITSTEAYKRKKEKERQERIAQLTLTRGDVFAGLINARMIDEDDLAKIIDHMPEETEEQRKNKKLSRNALKNALNFHRNHPLVDSIGAQLGVSKENLDLFFETSDYHYLLPV